MSALSVHLKMLQLGRLVDFRRDGKRVFYALTDADRELRDAIETLGD
jgi:DNA-binding transcriptional ArsR family regulator